MKWWYGFSDVVNIRSKSKISQLNWDIRCGCYHIKDIHIRSCTILVLKASEQRKFNCKMVWQLLLWLYIILLYNYPFMNGDLIFLWTNIPLFVELRSLGIGAAGTIRINAKGFPDSIKIERDKVKIVLPWGYLSVVGVEGVCCLVWQDNSSVFFMTSFHDFHQTVLRLRKRPKLSSTNGQVVRGVFGQMSRKALLIPTFIDDYNFNMGGVDIIDQLRSNYLIQQIVRRDWLRYFFGFLIRLLSIPTKSHASYYLLDHVKKPRISGFEFVLLEPWLY